MFTKISVLIPTRGRPERLKTLLASYAQTTLETEDASELIFRADADDFETIRFLLGQRVTVGPRLQGYRSMSTFFNEMLDIASGNVMMCGNDDMVFKTPGWVPLILAEANKYPDGLFNIGVTTYNEDHYPFSVVSRKVTQQLGFLWDPRIYWGDIFLRDVMATLGRAVKLPTVEIDHDWAGHEPDATFIEGDQNSIYQRDPAYWSTTHPAIVAEAVARLR